MTPPIDSFWLAVGIGVAVQGLVFGYVYCVMRGAPISWLLCVTAPIGAALAVVPLLHFTLASAIDPRWMMGGVLLNLVVQGGLAALFVTEPAEVDPEERAS